MPPPIPLRPVADRIEIGDGSRLRLVGVLGHGGSSTVHRGLLESKSGLCRPVAVKVYSAVSTDDADRVGAFIARTATRAASLRHPNIVQVYDFGDWRSQPYVVRELVDGVTLRALLDRYAERSLRLPLDLALFIACEIGDALAGALTARDHRGAQLSVLHRALGPRKVLLGGRGEVKVSDFDASMGEVASSRVRNLRVVVARTATMAPEVARGQAGDSRSDVFSLGVLLRELFVAPRFGPQVSNSEAFRLACEGFVQPMSFQPNLPAELVDVIARALQIAPGDRYPHAGAMAYELRRVALSMGVGDARLFLRRALARELDSEVSEVTAPHA